jgi:hypothetical protein
LKELLAAKNLKISGNKKILIQRLTNPTPADFVGIRKQKQTHIAWDHRTMHSGGVDEAIGLLVIDLETTGHGCYLSDIIQVAASMSVMNASHKIPFTDQVLEWSSFCKTEKKLAKAMVQQMGPAYVDLFSEDRLRTRYD